VTPSYGGMTYARLEKPRRSTGPARRQTTRDPDPAQGEVRAPDGLGVFTPLEWKPAAEVPDKDYR